MLGNGFLPMFARSGGVAWTGATWALDGSGRAYNSPTLGSELVTNGNFEGSFSGGLAANWGLQGAPTPLQETTIVHGGSKAQRIDATAANQGIWSQLITANGLWLMASAWARSDGTRIARMAFRNGNDPASGVTGTLVDTTSASYANITATWRALSGSTTLAVRAQTAASYSIYVDDVSAKSISLPTTLATITGNANNLTAAARIVSMTAGTQAGVVALLDSASNPQNFLIAYHDGTNVKLDKCVGGTYTNLISTAVAFTSNAPIEIRRPSGNTFQLWYNGVQRGADQTVSDASIINNTLYGLFSTYSGNLFTEFSLGGAVIPFGF